MPLQSATRGIQLVNITCICHPLKSLPNTIAISPVRRSVLSFALLNCKPNSIWCIQLAKFRPYVCALGARDPGNAGNWLKLAAMKVHFSLHPFLSDFHCSMCSFLGTEISVAYIVPGKSRIFWHTSKVKKSSHAFLSGDSKELEYICWFCLWYADEANSIHSTFLKLFENSA